MDGEGRGRKGTTRRRILLHWWSQARCRTRKILDEPDTPVSPVRPHPHCCTVVRGAPACAACAPAQTTQTPKRENQVGGLGLPRFRAPRLRRHRVQAEAFGMDQDEDRAVGGREPMPR